MTYANHTYATLCEQVAPFPSARRHEFHECYERTGATDLCSFEQFVASWLQVGSWRPESTLILLVFNFRCIIIPVLRPGFTPERNASSKPPHSTPQAPAKPLIQW
jgi:hypothetical protein